MFTVLLEKGITLQKKIIIIREGGKKFTSNHQCAYRSMGKLKRSPKRFEVLTLCTDF